MRMPEDIPHFFCYLTSQMPVTAGTGPEPTLGHEAQSRSPTRAGRATTCCLPDSVLAGIHSHKSEPRPESLNSAINVQAS